MLTATNREDFLGDLADQPETENQLAVSLAAATMEVERGAHIIRTHDTRETHDVVKVADALGDERTTRAETDSGPTVAELTDVTLREVTRHQALGETVAGGTDDGATLTFLLGDLTDDARASLRAVAEVTDVVVVEKDSGGLYVGGSAAAIKVVTDSLAEDGHRELAGELRTSLSRRV
jgi:dihydropteroate synthase